MNSPSPHPPSIEVVLSDLGWLRAFAISLVGEQHAEDLVQETATRALEQPPRHNRNLQAWMKRIAKNLAMSDSRQRKIRRERVSERTPESFSDGYSTEPLPDRSVEAAEATADLLQVIGQLPSQQRVIVLRRFQHEIPVAQIAEDLGISKKAVEKTIERARNNCKSALRYRHGNRWSVPCLLVIQQPDTLAPISAPLASSATKAALLSKPAVLGLGVAASLALALPVLLNPTPVAASGSGSAHGSIGAHLVGGGVGSIDPAFQPDLRELIGGGSLPTQPKAESTLNCLVTVHDERGAALEQIPIFVGSRLGALPSDYFGPDGEQRLEPSEFLTDGEGEITVPVSLSAETRLVAAHPDYALKRLSVSPGGESTASLEFILAPAAQVLGKVVDRHGRGIAGVTISAHARERGQSAQRTPEFRATSDARGEFRMVALPADDYRFRVSGTGTSTFWTPLQLLAPGENPTRIELQPGSEVSGEVLDGNGGAIEHAKVWLVRRGEVSTGFINPTLPLDLHPAAFEPSTGSFRAQHAQLDGQDQILVRAKGFVSALVDVPASGQALSIKLQPSSLSFGTQVFVAGRPAEAAQLQFSWNFGVTDQANRRQFRADRTGKAEIEISDGRSGEQYSIIAIHPLGTKLIRSEQLPPASGQLPIDLEPGTPVRLSLVDAAGNPVTGYKVLAELIPEGLGQSGSLFFSFETDANGESSFQFPDGQLTIFKCMEGLDELYIPPKPILIRGGSPIEIPLVLHDRRQRSFLVQDQFGRAIKNRDITLRHRQGEFASTRTTDTQGILFVSELTEGEFLPSMSAPYALDEDSAIAHADQVTVSADSNELQTITFAGLHDLQIELRGVDGSELPKRIGLIPQSQKVGRFAPLVYPITEIEVDQGGRARVEQMPAGKYWLFAPLAEARLPRMTEIEIPAQADSYVWEMTDHSLEGRLLQAAESEGRVSVSLELVVRDQAGRLMDLRAFGLPSLQAELNADGGFRFTQIPAGEWSLQARSSDGSMIWQQTIEIDSDGSSTTVQLDDLQPIQPGRVQILLDSRERASIAGELGEAFKANFSLLHLETQAWYKLGFDAEGLAKRDDLPAGSYQLYVLGKPQGQLIEILPGQLSSHRGE